MSGKVDIAALAKLARIEMSEEELRKLESEIPSILSFVEQIQNVETSAEAISPELRNVIRSDDNLIESGTYTEKLLSAAPARKGDRLVVKQVITRKQK